MADDGDPHRAAQYHSHPSGGLPTRGTMLRMAHWWDTHVHLESYEPADREAVLLQARANDVQVIGVAVDLESSLRLLDLVGTPGLAGVVVGVHPQRAITDWSRFVELVDSPGVVGIGECGFDPGRPDGPLVEWKLQDEAFATQARNASELDVALVLHIDGPGAWERFVINGHELDRSRVVRHYFTGDAAQAQWHRERGHYLSFGNPLRRNESLQRIAREYPPELLLTETDSYPLPGRKTQPADVVQVAACLADVRGWSLDRTREQLSENTVRAFRLDYFS